MTFKRSTEATAYEYHHHHHHCYYHLVLGIKPRLLGASPWGILGGLILGLKAWATTPADSDRDRPYLTSAALAALCNLAAFGPIKFLLLSLNSLGREGPS